MITMLLSMTRLDPWAFFFLSETKLDTYMGVHRVGLNHLAEWTPLVMIGGVDGANHH